MIFFKIFYILLEDFGILHPETSLIIIILRSNSQKLDNFSFFLYMKFNEIDISLNPTSHNVKREANYSN